MNRIFWLSVAGYFAATMIVAYPWHMLLFHDQYVAMGAFTRGEPIMHLGMAAVFVQGIVFAHILPMYLAYRSGTNTMRKCIEFSLFMGLNVYTVMVFATAAKFEIEPVKDFLIYGTAFQLLQFLVVGIVLGFIHHRSTVTVR